MEFQSQDSQVQDRDRNHNIGSESDNQDANNLNSQPRKSYERFTTEEKIKLEQYFEINPRPEENTRKEIADDLGIDPERVRFWFQNRRTQNKSKEMKSENMKLNDEVERLRAQLEVYKSRLTAVVCSICGGPPTVTEQHLRKENARLKEKIAQMTTMYAAGKPNPDPNFEAGTYSSFIDNSAAFLNNSTPIFESHPPLPTPVDVGPNNSMFVLGESSNSAVSAVPAAATQDLTTIAEAAAQELQAMAESSHPLWLPYGLANPTNMGIYILNETEFLNKYSVIPSAGLKREGTRADAFVQMTAFDIAETLINVDKWSDIFSGIVSRARTVEVYSMGTNYDGALQLISAEYQLPFPMVPTRESLFLRYCKRRPIDKAWVIVDVSLNTSESNRSIRICHKKPSGCLIYEMEDNSSKVVWVEHVEVDASVTDGIYNSLMNYGMAFGANRWLAALDRECDLREIVNSCNISNSRDAAETNLVRLGSVLKVAKSMRTTFYGSVSSTLAVGWELVRGSVSNNVQVIAKRNPSNPMGIIVNGSTVFTMPIIPKTIFDFICDDNSRNKRINVLFGNGVIGNYTFIPMSKGDNIRGLHLLVWEVNSENGIRKEMLMEESCYDPICSYIIYSPLDTLKVTNMLAFGGDPQEVQLLPSGFTIVPDGSTHGSFVTFSFQTVFDLNPLHESELTSTHVEIVETLVLNVVSSIKNEMLG